MTTKNPFACSSWEKLATPARPSRSQAGLYGSRLIGFRDFPPPSFRYVARCRFPPAHLGHKTPRISTKHFGQFFVARLSSHQLSPTPVLLLTASAACPTPPAHPPPDRTAQKRGSGLAFCLSSWAWREMSPFEKLRLDTAFWTQKAAETFQRLSMLPPDRLC